jgi:magnesium chelatase subunit I
MSVNQEFRTVPTVPPELPVTLGALRDWGWESRSVAEEMAANLEGLISSGTPLSTAVQGFENTVLPQLETAILAEHDIILLGERGQAKTRLIRSLIGLLDEWMPIVAGSEINDDPFSPVSAQARALVTAQGDNTPIAWRHRSERYGEKLATPDTTIADLIGEVDPIKVAEGRYLSDELTIHYGLVPRVNRGIFAINELPDLAERIQVGLLNVLEERDIQIRGHRIRLPLDIVLVATANPEDYTNRGRIITPLKDRFGAQIRTHYPREVDTEISIVRSEAQVAPTSKLVTVPWFIERIIVEVSHLARRSPMLNQRSGVSVRLTIANYESIVANAMRRSLRTGEDEIVPRISDLAAALASTQGKVEVETLEEGREADIIVQLFGAATLLVFRDAVVLTQAAEIMAAFDAETVAHTGDDLASVEYLALLARVPVLEAPTRAIAGDGAGPAEMASALEFLLEGLHLTKRLNKDASGPRALYRSKGS